MASLPAAPNRAVLAAPGHTDDSIALYHARTQTLISGDAVLSTRGSVWHTPEVVDPEVRATAAYQQELPVMQLLPGRGRPVHADPVWAGQRR